MRKARHPKLKKRYAMAYWTIDDVRAINPDLTEQEALDALSLAEESLLEAVAERGRQVLENLVPVYFLRDSLDKLN